jgi:hypothetical protein
MAAIDDVAGAERQPTTTQAVCRECGEKLECIEYIVCCTGTVFHICPACERKAQEEDPRRPERRTDG